MALRRKDCWRHRNCWSQTRYLPIRFRCRCQKPDSFDDDDDGGGDDDDDDDVDGLAHRALWEALVVPYPECFADLDSIIVAVVAAVLDQRLLE